MEHIINGIGIGLGLSILTGPLLFALIQASVEQGFRGGLLIASGIWISDFLCIGLGWYGFRQMQDWLSDAKNTSWLGVFGVLVLLAVGIGNLVNKNVAPPATMSGIPTNWASLIMKGFAINTFNPFTFFFWGSLFATQWALPNHGHSSTGQLLIGIMLTIISTDTLKAFAAKKVRPWLHSKNLLHLKQFAGVLFIIFAAVLAGRLINLV